MRKAIIIEDEDFAVNRLKMLLEDIEEDIEIEAVLGSIRDAVDWLTNNKTELIFLDINLSDGNAFKIFEQIQINTPIIFTTAYHEYALRAFEQCSIDYLLKPISRDKLKNSIKKLNTIQKESSDSENVKNIQELIELVNHQSKPKRYMVTLGNRLFVIDASEVALFESNQKMTFLYTFQGKKFSIDQSLKQLENELASDGFFRVNR